MSLATGNIHKVRRGERERVRWGMCTMGDDDSDRRRNEIVNRPFLTTFGNVVPQCWT